MKKSILVSACLAGIPCRYDGTRKNEDKKAEALVAEGKAIPVCPEQLGGEATPRPLGGIVGGTGEDVLNGKAKVLNQKGEDVTKEFVAGAKEVLKLAKLIGIKEAILKSKSPSCGCGEILALDKNLEKYFIPGDGVTTALLKRNGIKVKTEESL